MKITPEILEPHSKEDIIKLFVEISKKVDEQIAELKEEIRSLKEENRQLKQNKNSSNSSRPPSHDFGKVPRQKSLRKKGVRKSGGQPGHKGNTLNQSLTPDHIIVHTPEEICPSCGKQHDPENFRLHTRRQLIDLPKIKAVVTEHQSFQVVCNCGHESTGEFPAELNAPVQYGNNLTSLVSYLSTRQYISYNRIPELLKCFCNISLSEGTVFNMLERVANRLQSHYDDIKRDLLKAETIGSDETGIKVNSDKYWAWTWQTPTETHISIAPSRGYATIQDEFPDGFPDAVLVSDALAAQLKTPALKHQLCLAHLFRELNAFIEITEIPWPSEMKALLNKAIDLKKRLSPEQYEDPIAEREEIILEFSELLDKPPETEIRKLTAFYRRLKKWDDSIFTFLFHPEVPFDNNGSERAIRNVKVKQKVSGGFRSVTGARTFAVIRSVIDTWIKRNADVFDSLRTACSYAHS